MPRETGQHLLHYRLVEKIGAGAMGSVWRATDTTLDRDAAIKILPDALAEDDGFLARFEREAKLLAALSHPGLASVFGVHEADGTRFIAMELVPGKDLSTVLARGAMPQGEAVRVMTAVSEALEAAHAKGVVHRDLKPGNIRLLPDGQVKVLDLGLAKAVAIDAVEEAPLTSPGTLLGTAPYMSPEQARGHEVDARADIWSFGCVLWECLTGRRPFPGETVPDQIAAILHEDPDWAALPPDLSPGLARVLRRCLAKDARGRLHHIADARIELEDAGRARSGGGSAEGAASTSRNRLVPALIGVALIATITAYFLGAGSKSDDAPALILLDASFEKLTNWPRDELDADISPDGDYVSFLSDRDGPFEAFAGRIGSGVYDNLSSSYKDAAIVLPKATVRRVGFLGEGEGVWLSGGGDQRIRRLLFFSKRAEQWLQPGMIHVDWSPDGKRFVYSHSLGGDPLYVGDAAEATPATIVLPAPDGYHQHYPTWGVRGAWIYLVRGIVRTQDMDLWRMRPDGRELRQLTRDKLDVRYPTPLDSQTLLFVAKEGNGSGPWLWQLDLPSGRTRRATVGVSRYKSIAASGDGRRLVATVTTPEVSLWTVPIRAEGPATEADTSRHGVEAVHAAGPRVRGGRLYFMSSRGGGAGLWRHRPGEEPELLWPGRSGALVGPASVSRDGKRAAFVVHGHPRRLLILDVDASSLPRRLMEDVEVVGIPAWDPQGTWVAVAGVRDGVRGLYKARAEGGESVLVYEEDVMNPVWSPDGEMIVVEGRHVAAWCGLVALTPKGERIEDFPKIAVRPFGAAIRFLDDGSGFVYLGGIEPDQQFHLWDFGKKESRRLTQLETGWTLRCFDVTADGKTIVFDRERDHSDIVLIERPVKK